MNMINEANNSLATVVEEQELEDATRRTGAKDINFDQDEQAEEADDEVFAEIEPEQQDQSNLKHLKKMMKMW